MHLAAFEFRWKTIPDAGKSKPIRSMRSGASNKEVADAIEQLGFLEREFDFGFGLFLSIQ